MSTTAHRPRFRPRAGPPVAFALPGDRPLASLALPGIIFTAVALRVLSALVHGDAVTILPGIYDQVSYDALARRVLAGHGFTFPTDWWPATRAGEPTAHWSYPYTLYLAGIYALTGFHPLAARLIQATIAGILHPWLTWRIGRRVFGERAGLAAAGITAIYGYFVYYAAALMTETFTVLAILWALDLATGMILAARTTPPETRVARQPVLDVLKPWLLLGLALGLAASLRQVILLFAPFLFVWLIMAMRRTGLPGQGELAVNGIRSLVGGLSAAVVVTATVIVPWTVHNFIAFNQFVPLNTNAGYAFFWANHPIYGTEFTPLLPGNTYQELVPAELRDLDEATLDRALLREGLRFVAEDPSRYALLSLSRVKYYFQFWPSTESGPLSNLVRAFSFGVCLPFMLYGLVIAAIAGARCQFDDRRPLLVLLYLFISVYSLVHLLSWALIRYRLPVDAVLILFAGLAVVDIAARLGRAPGFPSPARAEHSTVS
jgi:4-amino-4-deoxy-L-arabinose transferase-like glycosyltransferase